jgi:hypothetical protein
MLCGIHYVYTLFRLDGTPFYVGVGKGRRWLDHEKRYKRAKQNPHKNAIIKSIRDAGLKVPKRKFAEGLTRSEAFSLEVATIRLLGRYPNGPLVNATDGGDGNRGWTDEARKKNGECAKARNTGMVGPWRNRKRSEEDKRKISESQKGKKKSPEHIERIRATSLLRPTRSEETKAKMRVSAALRWERYRAGIAPVEAKPILTAADRARSLVGLSNRGRTRSPETRAKMAAGQRARRENERNRLAAAGVQSTQILEAR